MPRSWLSRRTSSHTAARLDGSSPVVGSSRNSTSGSCTSASGEVETPLHPAGVGADRAGRSRRRCRPEPAARQLAGGARSTLSPYRRPCRSSSSRPVCFGSSAASCSATPIRSRTISALSRDVETGNRRRARGRQQQRRQHANRCALAGTVGPEEAVDLTLGDFEIDAVDRHRLAEPASEVVCLQRGDHCVEASCYGVRAEGPRSAPRGCVPADEWRPAARASSSDVRRVARRSHVAEHWPRVDRIPS